MWCHVVLGIFLSRHPGTTASTGQWTHHRGVARFYHHVTKTWNKQNSWRPFCVSATRWSVRRLGPELREASGNCWSRPLPFQYHYMTGNNINSNSIQFNGMKWSEPQAWHGFHPRSVFQEGVYCCQLNLWNLIHDFIVCVIPKDRRWGWGGGYFKDAQSLSCLSRSAAGRYKWWKQDVLWVVSFTSVWTHRQFPSKAAAERVNLHCFFNSFLPTIQITTAV